jgi:hypothetical protein
MLVIQQAVDAALESFPAPLGSRVTLPIGVESLDPAVHGRFALVFSANVLEHVEVPGLALDRMQALLSDGGVQRHVCPNYAFPYEPHFFIPLIPLLPSATARLLPSSITHTGLWASLNFVTAGHVYRWASKRGLRPAFDAGVLAEALDRFVDDTVFAERHSGLGRAVRIIRQLGLVGLVRRLPPCAVSPMRFSVASAQVLSGRLEGTAMESDMRTPKDTN